MNYEEAEAAIDRRSAEWLALLNDPDLAESVGKLAESDQIALSGVVIVLIEQFVSSGAGRWLERTVGQSGQQARAIATALTLAYTIGRMEERRAKIG